LMAVPVGSWPNANAANSSLRRAPPPRFFVCGRAPYQAPHAAPCGPARPNVAPCCPGPMRPHTPAPCGPMRPHAPGFSARTPVPGRGTGTGSAAQNQKAFRSSPSFRLTSELHLVLAIERAGCLCALCYTRPKPAPKSEVGITCCLQHVAVAGSMVRAFKQCPVSLSTPSALLQPENRQVVKIRAACGALACSQHLLLPISTSVSRPLLPVVQYSLLRCR
jgi:hypothetical protein